MNIIASVVCRNKKGFVGMCKVLIVDIMFYEYVSINSTFLGHHSPPLALIQRRRNNLQGQYVYSMCDMFI